MNMCSRLLRITFSKSLLVAMLMLASFQAHSMELDAAKNSGLIGELANGYLGAVSQPASKEVNSLINNINIKRKEKYEEIANEKDVPLAVVEKRSGKKLLEMTESGNYINDGSGWQKK